MLFPDYEEEVVKVAASTTAKTVTKGSHVSMHSSGFRDFLLKPELLKAITDCGFEHPSQVQHECIPQAILGTDIICQAKAGMGKTAVFVLSTLHQIQPKDGEASVLVVAHTRELAFQISKEFERFSKHLNPAVKTDVFFGGTPVDADKKKIKASHPVCSPAPSLPSTDKCSLACYRRHPRSSARPH